MTLQGPGGMRGPHQEPPYSGSGGGPGPAYGGGHPAPGPGHAGLPAVHRQGSGLSADARPTLYVESVPKDATRREVAHIFRPFPGFKVPA